jgi:hypothetical protein
MGAAVETRRHKLTASPLRFTARWRLGAAHRSRSLRLFRPVPLSPLPFLSHIKFLSPNLRSLSTTIVKQRQFNERDEFPPTFSLTNH